MSEDIDFSKWICCPYAQNCPNQKVIDKAKELDIDSVINTVEKAECNSFTESEEISDCVDRLNELKKALQSLGIVSRNE